MDEPKDTSPFPNAYKVGNFRKKPVVIEAMQANTQEDIDVIDEWMRANGTHLHRGANLSRMTAMYTIQTLEGEMVIDQGDWVIRGVKGEFYPCKPDIFAMTYDEERS